MNFTRKLSFLVSLVALLSPVISFTSFTTNNGVGKSFVASKRSMSSLRMTLLTYNGKKVEVKEGSPLSAACKKAGMKVKYSCKKGDCGTCQVSVGGSRIKACIGKVPPAPRLKSLQEKGLPLK